MASGRFAQIFKLCFKMGKRNCIVLLLIGATILNIYMLKQHWITNDGQGPLSANFGLTQQQQYSDCSNLPETSNKKKLILLWTPGKSNRTKPVKGWDVTGDTFRECPFKCDFTDRKDLQSISDAIFYNGAPDSGQEYPPLPDRKGKFEQIWVFFRLEPPAKAKDLSIFDNKFNWTSTYRFDSDVPYRYGRFEKQFSKDLMIPTEESLRNKSLVGWMNSNCETHSYREVLAKKLKEVIQLDIFGKCSSSGLLNCTEYECYQNFSKQYKFWLSFENSLCEDYLTENFNNPLLHGIVPILYAHPSIARFIPKGSYINATEFGTIKDLANYLQFLDGHPEEYLRYFEWRKYLRVSRDTETQFWCSFCTKLHSGSSTPKYYSSLYDWFYQNYTSTVSQCLDPSGSLFN